MQLAAFLRQFGSLGDEFLFHFNRPFLLEEGRLELGSEDSGERHIFYLSGEGDEPLLVGRKADAHVRIREPNVSSRHARLFPASPGGREWRIVDLGSTNGTYLNGEQLTPRKPYPLQDEAVLAFGPATAFVFVQPHTILVLLRRLLARDASTPPRPVSLGSDTEVSLPAAALDDVSGAAAERRPAEGDSLFVYCDPFDPVPLAPGQTLVVGRSAAKADLVLPHPLVSRRHAEIERRPDGVFVRDLLSANGSNVDEEPLKREWVRLGPEQTLRIADFRLSVQGPPSQGADDTHVMPASRKAGMIQGKLETIPVEDLLVRIEENSKTGVLELVSDELSGRVTFRAGHLHQARTSDGLSGADAVRRLLKLRRARFTFDPTGEVGERDVEVDFSRIVLEEFLDGN